MTQGSWLLAYNPNDVRPGWIAFFVVLALVIGTVLLWRNMNKQLHKIRVPHGGELGDDTAESGGVRRSADATPDGGVDDKRSPGQP